MSRRGVVDAIKAHLVAYTPPFELVVGFEPTGFPAMGGPYAAFWYAGETEKSKTFGNVMVAERIMVRLYWRQLSAAEANEELALTMWDAVRGVQALLRGDSKLGGNCTDLEVGLATVGISRFEEGVYNAAEFELQVDELEAEAISG